MSAAHPERVFPPLDISDDHSETCADAETDACSQSLPSSIDEGFDLSGNPLWPTLREYGLERWRGDDHQQCRDHVIEEVPVAIAYNGQPHAVMLATPDKLQDFAIGFSLTEGIVENLAQIHYVQIYQRLDGIEAWLRIPDQRFAALGEKTRNLTGRTGCGLCGTANLSQVIRQPAKVSAKVKVSLADLRSALLSLSPLQTLNRQTGAVHGAAWAVPGIGITHVREDVGRHNALDKLIGALIQSQAKLDAGFVIVTSRASFEMVQKCASVGIGFLAAISAPTGLAIRLADETGLTLVGFARGDNCAVYAHPQRLLRS
jgi:FdhD protein